MKGISRWVTVEGLNLERFIRLAGEKGVVCRKTRRKGRRYTVLVAEEHVPILAETAQQGGWKFTSGSRYGFGRYVSTLRRHWLLAALALAVVVGIGCATQMMWHIQLVDAGAYKADAEIFLREYGVLPPRRKSNVDLNELREAMEWRYPDVAWIDCGWRGTTLRIIFVEGISSRSDADAASRDIIAARSGIVESIITTSGTPAVVPGQVIEAGQTLIIGYERGKDEEQLPVSARGVVTARVWDSTSASISLYENQTQATGRQQNVSWVDCGFFPLNTPSQAPYEHYDASRKNMPLGGLFFPFTIQWEERIEVSLEQTPRSLEEAQAEAGEAAMRLLQKKTGFHDDFVDKWVDYCMIEDEVVCAVAWAERIIDVACYAQPDE